MLPSRPLRLKPSFVWTRLLGGIVLLSVGVACTVGFVWWQCSVAVQLLEESWIWKSGVPALETLVTGQSLTTRFIFHDHVLLVKYADAAGVQRLRPLRFHTIGADLDRTHPPIARYLKDDPERIALSWAVDVTLSRWASVIILAVVGGGLIGGTTMLLGLGLLRRLADALRCASYSDEVIVRITEVARQSVHGRHTGNTFQFTGQTADGRVVTGKVSLPKKQEPLFADPDRQTMVVLAGPGERPRAVALRGDFYPFALDPDEQAAARATISTRGRD